jgi:hypothetical protein
LGSAGQGAIRALVSTHGEIVLMCEETERSGSTPRDIADKRSLSPTKPDWT